MPKMTLKIVQFSGRISQKKNAEIQNFDSPEPPKKSVKATYIRKNQSTTPTPLLRMQH